MSELEGLITSTSFGITFTPSRHYCWSVLFCMGTEEKSQRIKYIDELLRCMSLLLGVCEGSGGGGVDYESDPVPILSALDR